MSEKEQDAAIRHHEEEKHREEATAHTEEVSTHTRAADTSLIISQTEREKFVRRVVVIMVTVVLALVVLLFGTGLLFSQKGTLNAIRSAFTKHKEENRAALQTLDVSIGELVRKHELSVTVELRTLRQRIDLLEKFIKKKGFTPPSSNGGPSSSPKNKPNPKPRPTTSPSPECRDVLGLACV